VRSVIDADLIGRDHNGEGEIRRLAWVEWASAQLLALRLHVKCSIYNQCAGLNSESMRNGREWQFLHHLVTTCLAAMVEHTAQRRAPAPDLRDPVGQGRQRRTDDERTGRGALTHARQHPNDLTNTDGTSCMVNMRVLKKVVRMCKRTFFEAAPSAAELVWRMRTAHMRGGYLYGFAQAHLISKNARQPCMHVG
jgi:hypothetical protein